MNYFIGTLIASMALGGTPAVQTPTYTAPPSVQEESLIVFEQTPAEKQAEEEQKAAEEAKRIAEEEKKAEEAAVAAKEAEAAELKAKAEAEKKLTQSLNYDFDIASSTTHYSQSSGNANRNFNMLLASDSVNGTILKPGESYSFNNNILSHRSAERDYKPAGVISDGKIVNAIGGGICQISSTLYNAALYSGMTITDRRNHSLMVGYLPAGRDATASWGTIDFCFRNDLSVPVKIESVMADGTLKIRFLAPENPNVGNIELKVVNNGGVYTLYRYVDGAVNYTAKSVYKG